MFEYLSIKLSSDTVFSMCQSDGRINEAIARDLGTFRVPYVWQFWVIFTIRAFFESNLLKSELDVSQVNPTRVTERYSHVLRRIYSTCRERCALPDGVNNKKRFPRVDNQPIITSFGRVMLSIELIIKHFKGRVKLILITIREICQTKWIANRNEPE